MNESVFHHLALPQRLPHSEEANLDEIEAALIDQLITATRLMHDSQRGGPTLQSKASDAWESIRRCLVVSKAVNRGGKVNREKLLWELRSMAPSDALLLHVRSQNAALFMHRISSSPGEVIFEVFEAAPQNEAVFAADDVLQWDFPGSAIAVPLATFQDDDFQASLAEFLEQASLESTKAFAAFAQKAGIDLHEYRDTANPTIISSMLMAILEENSRRISTPLLRKRVRDDVCWSRAGKPWRRSPRWLVLRVAISRYLMLALGPELGRFEYKFLLCVCFATFLESAHSSLTVDQVHFLKAKLCRRLVKLDVARSRAQDQNVLHIADVLFSQLTPRINIIIQDAVLRVESLWREFKQGSTKTIPALPRRALRSDTTLSLRVSGDVLRRIQATPFRRTTKSQPKWVPPHDFDMASETNEHFTKFATPYFRITELESTLHELDVFSEAASPDLSLHIRRFVEMGLPLYSGNVGQMSLLILNVMELWMRFDQETCRKFPLLRQYHPAFTPETMDALHLARYEDMVRLQTIQLYLDGRIKICNGLKTTIFDDPTNDCFARRYYDECLAAEPMRALRSFIEETAERMKQSKLKEWQRESAKYESLTRQVNSSTCILTVDENDPFGRAEHIEHLCPRCRAIRKLSGLRIQIYEHPLPSNDYMVKVVVFELACPQAFAAYRDTTWMLLSRLASPAPVSGIAPKCLLREYSPLREFAGDARPEATLASLTKPFLKTHYAYVSFPVDWDGGRDGVCRPNGLKLAYFDTTSSMWTGRSRTRPQFCHHLQLHLPQNSPFRSLLSQAGFAADAEGPSSYEIMATQMTCPSGSNLHEFLAFKTLMSGSARRWISILVELGSTNLNWSGEATMMLLNRLALQCGPPSEQNDPLRLIHSVFRDTHFVEKLLEQVASRLSALSAPASWREAHLMGAMITLALRTLDLADAVGLGAEIYSKALGLVVMARDTCVRWFRLLREEIQTSPDALAAQQLQQRALAAALLCRRTFVIHIEHFVPFDPVSLETYVESGIVVQENMVSDINSLPQTMLQDLVLAIKLSYRLQKLVSRSIKDYPKGFRNALKHFWPDADRIGSVNSTITLGRPGWVRCDITGTEMEYHQAIHFNLLLGTLLINGKPVGKLPQDSQNSELIKELFRGQPLRVYQSQVPGMTYVLTHRPNNYMVHIGYEGTETVILAMASGIRIRLIPRDRFHSGHMTDLPGPLIHGRFHWLNLETGDVYVTPVASPWTMSNNQTWTLNIHNGTCWRQRPDKKGHEDVVDPLSLLFQRFAKILSSLVHKRELLVTQPSDRRSGLEVQINLLQLMFFVNHNKLLYSPQLRLEIDPNQDAGTWYGLLNKLVCRNVSNPFRRTVLVPLGNLSVKRWGCHVAVSTENTDKYGKFDINDTLGRIDCAAEPMLTYTKALLHAYTSFFLPDPLTGRTGSEESLDWLQSGICRPWTVLGNEVSILNQIARLTPVREYYPSGLKVMKTERWDERLTCHIQHPLYRQVIEGILAVSEELRSFATTRSPQHESAHHLPVSGDVGLTARALLRRRLHERKADSDDENLAAEGTDHVYESRDKPSLSDARYAKVMEFTHLLRTKPEKFGTPVNLAAVLAQGNTIGGYGAKYDKVSLSDRMHDSIRENWGSLVEYCRGGQSSYSLMFLFAALSFRGGADDGLLKALAAFAIFGELQSLKFPPWHSYFNFRPDSNPTLEGICTIIKPFKVPVPKDDTDELSMLMPAKQRRKMKGVKDAHELRSEEDCRYLAKFFLAQWPCPEPNLSKLPRTDLLVDINAALEAIKLEWLRLYQNRELSVHLRQVQHILNKHHSGLEYMPPTTSMYEESFQVNRDFRGSEVPTLGLDLLARRFDPHLSMVNAVYSLPGWVPLSSVPQDGRQYPMRLNENAVASNARPQASPEEARSRIRELYQIIGNLGKSKSLVRKNYARDLQRSLEAFENLRTPQQLPKSFLFLRNHSVAKSEVFRTFSTLKTSLEQQTLDMSSRRIQWLQLGGLWPAITTVTLLERLRSTANSHFGSGMQSALISFGLAITKLQREMRLNDYVLAGDTSRFQDEESNIGHSNWRPEDHPDWLLLEIDSSLLIRPDQVDVALATISPPSGVNSVLQMNMGQGKTSFIIPMAVASMADKNSLVRVIVPKALLLQTAQLLQSRLGGMLNRHVSHIPFSRRTPTHENSIRLYYEIHKRTLKKAGVMLCMPEHNLSFMLSGQQRILDNKMNEAKPMIRVHNRLRSLCRDILDESDYTLAARTQLIYPSGSQVPVDGHPHRWQTAQSILSLVDQHLYGLENSFPRSIEVVRRPGGGFPLIYFLRRDVEDELLRRLAADISKGFGDILPVGSFDGRDRAAIRDFLSPSTHKLKPNTVERIRCLCPDRPQIKQTVYLLRGLLVNRILLMTLEKRWNVQYGLRPNSDPIAVPYHAKGVPSEQSEWGHPDVAILFTCLVFYYDGISNSQLRQALARVLKSNDPSTEYDKWVQNCDDFPASLRAWNTINVEDNSQVQEIWKAVRYRVVVIDYFLNNFVFPPHAKQFKAKLQSSGWDIPLFSAQPAEPLESKRGQRPLTTGFSGTNDNRTLLPLTIQQADLPSLSHTNAEVLTYLLHDRSRRCAVITDVRGGRATERDLLFMLKKQNIKILIDAGAQILEMDNETLAKTWLEIDKRYDAALYFDSANKPWVISKGRKTPLLASPYADDLDKCFVYLDEASLAHTRGTDLKLPLNARGALTVGQGQSKDHTVQAAMRLRQLGTTQAITFFVPPEVHQMIVDLRKKSIYDRIDSHDVICWLLDNTCDSIEQLQPLYYSQGIDFCRRTQAAIDNPEYLTDPDHRAKYVASIRQNELQTLQEMYEPKGRGAKHGDFKSSNPKVAAYLDELNLGRKSFQDTGRAVHGSALQEVEQEREIAFEVEAVRQVKKPVQYDALSFPGLHRDLEIFARTGRLPVDSHAILHVFHLISATALGRKHRLSAKGNHAQSKLFVSIEFKRTVKLYTHLAPDNFLRPVSWVLWSALVEAAVVLIPEEAERIIRMMHAKKTHPQIHLITYASPTKLGLLAGRLYFEWHEYEALCQFLGVTHEYSGSGLPLDDDEEDDDSEQDGDDNDEEMSGNRTTPHKRQSVNANSFSPRPLTFLQEWLAIRRHGQDFVHTPMGFLTQGKPLYANHPFFGEADSAAQPVIGDDLARSAGASGSGSDSRWGTVQIGDVDNEEVFDGVDDMGANIGEYEEDEDDDEVMVYDDSEQCISDLSETEAESE
ncbi:hypothetical protein MMYC01_201930 [Madurella mycetomatis]|uniref:ubiquitinyl hydrolase 1 n=1 Tax=Madurella mycetomatis TaxID=100816 RepID=A0A175WDV2_9PEZI|nr:hypothetical protein MMYC01_201930 [Madurella mycetomatis]